MQDEQRPDPHVPLTTSAAARALGVSEASVLGLERRGLLRCVRTSTGLRLFSLADVERLADERRSARRG